jgi:2-polyprenyl-3-methyl-5-hydroxy-6-metoxy-1,4-benzoquinol methylase
MYPIKKIFKKLHKGRSLLNRTKELNLIKFHWPRKDKIINANFKKKKRKELECLHIGCSKGYDTRLFFNKKFFNIFGIDLNNFIEQKKIPKFKFMKVDFMKMKPNKEFPNKFDIILLQAVLHHFRDYKKTLNKCINLLKNNGVLFVQCNMPLPLISNINNQGLRKIENKKFLLIIKDLTYLGFYLSKNKSSINIEKNLKYLNIKKNKFSTHYFIHYFLLRSFYNNKLSFSDNLKHNKDWYLPEFSHKIDLNYIKKLKNVKIIDSYSPSPSTQNLVIKKK